MKAICGSCNFYLTIAYIIRYDEFVNHKYMCGRCTEKYHVNRRRQSGFRPNKRRTH